MSTPNVWEQAREALGRALTWEGLLNEASQLGEQGPRGIRECLTIKATVLREVNAARAALAEIQKWTPVTGCAPERHTTFGWSFLDGVAAEEEGERPAILLVRKEELLSDIVERHMDTSEVIENSTELLDSNARLRRENDRLRSQLAEAREALDWLLIQVPMFRDYTGSDYNTCGYCHDPVETDEQRQRHDPKCPWVRARATLERIKEEPHD